MSQRRPSQELGLGVIAVLLILVVLAALAAAIVRLGSASARSSALGLEAARALQAAHAGTQWGLYQALKGPWSACLNSSQTLDLRADTGMRVTVRCSHIEYREGESAPGVPQPIRLYTIEAVACNGSGSCPDDSRAAQPGYVERLRRVQASDR